MDLRRPADLETVIAKMFYSEVQRAVGHRIIAIDPSAFEPLVAPARPSRYDLRNVDPNRLQQALHAVAGNLDTVLGADRVVEAAHVQRAIRGSSCHYLWFC